MQATNRSVGRSSYKDIIDVRDLRKNKDFTKRRVSSAPPVKVTSQPPSPNWENAPPSLCHKHFVHFYYQVKTEPGVTATKSQPITGVPTTASQATGNPASMLTVSALPSMDETVASTRQPLITPLKRKHEDEDDDYDS